MRGNISRPPLRRGRQNNKPASRIVYWWFLDCEGGNLKWVHLDCRRQGLNNMRAFCTATWTTCVCLARFPERHTCVLHDFLKNMESSYKVVEQHACILQSFLNSLCVSCMTLLNNEQQREISCVRLERLPERHACVLLYWTTRRNILCVFNCIFCNYREESLNNTIQN